MSAPLQRMGRILAGSAYIPPHKTTDAERRHTYGALKPLGWEPTVPMIVRVMRKMREW